MATCIKTGAQIYLSQYGAYVYGDLHQVSEDVFVMRTSGPRRFEPFNGSNIVHGLVADIYEWWEESAYPATYGTLIITQMQYLGYEGVELVPAKPHSPSPA
jgi:hypothetical protein